MKKRALSLLLTLTMLLSLVPAFSVGASAIAFSYRYPVYNTVDDPSSGIKQWADGICSDFTSVTSTDTTWGTEGQTTWYVVSSDVSITNSVTVAGDVYLILNDGATLTVTGSGKEYGNGNPGIKANGHKLTIYGQSGGTGVLNATGAVGSGSATSGAGIRADNGTLIINGGTVTANGYASTGYAWSGEGISVNNGTLIINGGTVTATGGNNTETAIQGGWGGDGISGSITINGGTVTATGGTSESYNSYYGNGIEANGISINGGTVTASGYYGISAIGMTGAPTLSITGGTVNAKGSGNPQTAIIRGHNQGGSMNGAQLTIANTMQVTGANETYTAETWRLTNKTGVEYVTIFTPVCAVDSPTGTAYASVQEAITAAGDTPTVIYLLADDTEDVNTSGRDIKIALNKHKMTGEVTNSATNSVSFVIAFEEDMRNAMQILPVETRQVWEIDNDITLTQFVRLINRYLTIDGNGHTISGAGGTGEPKMTQQMFAIDSVNRDSRNHVYIENLTLVGSERFQNVLAVQNKDTDTSFGIKLTLKDVTIDQHACRGNGAPIVNFGSKITVKGNFTVKTCEDACYAIGMILARADDTLTHKADASLIFDNAAVVTFEDNRTDTSNPLITIAKSDLDGTATVSGNYVTERLTKVERGYELGAVVVSASADASLVNQRFGSISAALTAAGTNKTSIYLVGNDTENVTIANSQNITLDLNGYVLKADTEGSVITNNGTLYITDSDTSVVRYFEDSDGDGCYEAIYDTEADSRIAVTGGVITGGTGTTVGSYKYGGGIYNYGTLTVSGGNIVGNSAEYGGAIALMDNAQLEMTGGTIVGNTSSSDGAGVFIKPNAVFTMDNGTIAYNTTATTGGGGGVHVCGTFVMNGGTILNNNAKRGAGVYVYFNQYLNPKVPGTFTMNGGTIKSNIASDKGGGVYVDDYATVLLKGTITGNTAGTLGGGVCCNSGITVGGALNVTGNKVGTAASNVVLRHDSNPAKNGSIDVDATLAQNAAIGVTYLNNNKKAAAGDLTGTLTSDCSAYFTSDNTAYVVVYDTNVLKFAEIENQAAPSVTAVAETIKGKADGKITGVTDKMEYKASADTEYTKVSTGVTELNLPVGTYKVRYAAKTAYYASPDTTVTISAGSTLTLTFDAQSGSAVNPATNLEWHDKLATLPDTTRSGYDFKEWNSASDGSGMKLTTAYEVEADATFYAIWTEKVSSSVSVSSYAVTANTATHGSVSVDKKNAAAGNTVTLTVKVDKGWTLETLTVKTAAGSEVTLTAKKLGETYTFTMPASAVTVTATFMEDNTMLNFFVDVKAADYYYDAVLWAAENGITSGVDATHFAPMDITTRGQMVTFLWRAAGSPEPTATTTAFTDVEKGSYYEKAVLWAVEKGITNGMTATSFDPYGTVTRGQTVAFLARYEGVKDNATGYSHSFGDVASDMYYSNAVAWAASSGITTGATETTFAPNDSCTRGQIVTFIYRDIVK